jgi:sugar lactone lactonase YvrE
MRTSLAIPTVVLALALAPLGRGASVNITTLAGVAPQGSADGGGTLARFANPWGVAGDTNGNFYVADTDNHTIRKITSGGSVSTLAGLAGVSGSADGSGSNARFNQPQGVAVDNAGNIYVADTGNYTIRKITPAGAVTTLAGSAGNAGSTDASGSSARFYEPEGIAVKSDGSRIYVADTWNHTIRQITAAGAVSTLAGLAGNSGSTDASGSSARFYQPQGVAVDGAGNIYVGDTGNHTIRKITSSGAVTTLAGSAGNYGSADGTGSSASFWAPQGVALDSATNLYVADSLNNTIRKVTPGGAVSTLAGTAGTFGSQDGSGGTARFWLPQSTAVDGQGNIYVADSANGTIRKIAGTTVSTVAGSASIGSADGTGSAAHFYGPSGAAIDSTGISYIADTGNSTIRKVTSAGSVSTLAGSAGNTGSADGSGSSARFSVPQGVAVDTSGTVYVADTANHTIRKIASGSVTTLAGAAGTNGVSDGNGSNARFNAPQGLAVDLTGNLYVADTWNHAIRKVTNPGGVVTTVAGVAGYSGCTDADSPGDGTNTARFYCPGGVAVDASGNLYVADTGNHVIRKVSAAGGAVSTLAGLAGVWGSADGTNSSARFCQPQDLTVDGSGNLYVLDSGNHTIRLVTPVGTNWVVTTLAGLTNVSGSADGAGSAARFCYPGGLGMNNVGSLCVADWGNNTIRAGVTSANTAPSILAQPQPQTVAQGQNATFSVVATGSAPLSYQWLLCGTNLQGATASSYTCNSAQPANAGPYSVIVSNPVTTVTSSTALLTVVVPPTITTPPQGLTVDQNTSANFTVAASGTSPFAYQWLFNGATISTATASAYTRANAQPGDAGSYSVIVSNFAGSVTSAPAILTVNLVPTPPSITTQPQGQTVAQGSVASFNVTASGSSPFSYQWRLYGTNLNGTASSYTVASAQPGNAGPYSVVVTNAYGAITSAVATLTVVLPPIINVQPASQVSAVSNSVTFSVGLSQGTSPAYQWSQNGTAISGATLSSLTLASISWSSAGTYSVVVSNLAGSQISADATLIVQQASFSFFDGFETYNKGALEDTATGTPNPTSIWWGLNSSAQSWVTNANGGVTPHGGSQMAGAAALSKQSYINLLYRMNAGQPYYGNFMCEWWFYDPYGTSSTGANASQEYIALCSYFPVSTTGDTSSFTAYNQRMSLGTYNGSGFNNSTYQARIMGGSGGNFGSGNSWYNTSTRSVGWHHARVVVGIPNVAALTAPVAMYIDNMITPTVASTATNAAFNLIEVNHYSSAAGTGWYYDDLTFRADNDPWIVEQPVSSSAAPGQPASFTTVAVGTGYQWQFNGNDISGATTSAYSIASVAATNFGSYACVISGTNGTLTSSQAVLTVTGPPVIVQQPGSLTVTQAQAAAFSVTPAGTTPLSCQWLLNSTPIAGATATSYSLASAYSTNAGSYTVVVTNAWGSATSAVATLTVLVPPSIATQPVSLTVTQNQNALFSVTPAGTTPLGCQWQFHGAALPGATATSYTVTSAQPANAGSYTVVVTNSVGSITSAVATLTVQVPPSITAQPQSQTNLVGNCAVFSVAASGTAPMWYQWRWNGAPQASGTDLTSYSACSAGSYSVLVSNIAGTLLSATATLSFTNPPPAQRGHFDSTLLRGEGSLYLSMSGTPYTNYVLEFTADWTNWTPLTTLSATNGLFNYTDPSVATNAQRFYRLRLAP